MAHHLILWGLDLKKWDEEREAATAHGCVGDIVVQEEGDAAWCAACFPSLAAAEACAANLQERFSHLQVCMEPDWENFGKSKATAAADLVRLAERLGCRDKPQVLPQHEAVCLARGASAVLAALKALGGNDGVEALARADRDAAICLCHSLIQAVDDLRRRWLPRNMHSHVGFAFGVLARRLLPLAVAQLHEATPGSAQRACAASRLLHAFLRTHFKHQWLGGQLDAHMAEMMALMGQDAASKCLQLLRAVADSLDKWLLAAAAAWLPNRKQQQQQQRRQQQPARPLRAASELHQSSIWLPAAAGSLLLCVQLQPIRSAIDVRQLLHTLGQLIHRVVACQQLEARPAPAGLWSAEPSAPSADLCVGQLYITIVTILPTMDDAACAAAGLPALHDAVSQALGTALDHLATPRRLLLLYYLSSLAQATLHNGTREKAVTTVTGHFVRVQQLATTWVRSGLPPGGTAVNRACGLPKLSPADQLAMLVDVNALQLAGQVTRQLMTSTNKFSSVISDRVFGSGAVDALAAALQVAPCRNVRALASDTSEMSTSSCLAPGLFHAAGALLMATEVASFAATESEPWASDAVAALVCGALGSLQLAQAEAAAQRTLPRTSSWAPQPDPRKPYEAQLCGANILAGLTHGVAPPVARTLANRGLVGPLLQVMPWWGSASEQAGDIKSWQTTVVGTASGIDILEAVFVADASARAAVLRDGSWDAAIKRIRDLQPPHSLAAGWPEQREALLRSVTTVLAHSRRGRAVDRHGTPSGSTAGADVTADAEAAAAADRAMQELLAEEQSAEAQGRRSSKGAAKRTRKKAAKQQAAAASRSPQGALGAHQASAPAADSAGSSEAQAAGSAPKADTVQPAAAVASQAADTMALDSQGLNTLPKQQPAAAAAAAADPEWWRCPLSSRVMHDPVLYGTEGHSFERAALEQWLAANPGVDPLSRQPLLPGEGSIVANHALRSLLQQLQLS